MDAAAVEPVPPAVRNVAKRIAALVVAARSVVETPADADMPVRVTASAAPDTTTPRRVSPRRSLSRARANRLRTVPGGQRSRRAASSSVSPAK
jgi:hypothetical protein